MKKNAANSKSVPVEPKNRNQRNSQLESFEWTPDLPLEAKVSARRVARLVDHVKDIANGAAVVFELITDHESDVDNDDLPYLNPYYLGVLRRMAQRSLEELVNTAEKFATDLHNMEKGMS